MTAEVAIKTSAKTHGSASQVRLRLEAKEVFMLTQDQKGAWIQRALEDVDLPYYFSQDVTTGAVTNLHHDPAEKYFILQIKHEIARMHDTGLKQIKVGEPINTTEQRASQSEGGSVAQTHHTTSLVEVSATHLVVRKTRTGVSHHRVWESQGEGRATLHHRGEETMTINRNTGALEQSKKHTHVQTDDGKSDENTPGPGETCDREQDTRARRHRAGPAGRRERRQRGDP